MPFSSFTGVLVFSVASTWGVIRIVLGGGGLWTVRFPDEEGHLWHNSCKPSQLYPGWFTAYPQAVWVPSLEEQPLGGG